MTPAANVTDLGSSPTRIRTRNFRLEAGDDFRFTIEPLCKAEGEGVGPSRQVKHAQPGSNRFPSPIGLPFRISTAARPGFEPGTSRSKRDMMSVSPSSRFAKAEGMGFEPTGLRKSHGLANRPGKPYPATFRKLSGPQGNRTLLTDLARICRPLGTCQPISEVRPGIEPGLRPYHRRVLPQHLQTLSFQK